MPVKVTYVDECQHSCRFRCTIYCMSVYVMYFSWQPFDIHNLNPEHINYVRLLFHHFSQATLLAAIIISLGYAQLPS